MEELWTRRSYLGIGIRHEVYRIIWVSTYRGKNFPRGKEVTSSNFNYLYLILFWQFRWTYFVLFIGINIFRCTLNILWYVTLNKYKKIVDYILYGVEDWKPSVKKWRVAIVQSKFDETSKWLSELFKGTWSCFDQLHIFGCLSCWILCSILVLHINGLEVVWGPNWLNLAEHA